MTTFTQVVLYTDTDGRARFKEETIALTEGKPESRLSALMASGGYQPVSYTHLTLPTTSRV